MGKITFISLNIINNIVRIHYFASGDFFYSWSAFKLRIGLNGQIHFTTK